MKQPTAGSAALHQATHPKISTSELAAVTSIGRQRLTQMAAGKVEPTASEMTLLREHLGIPLEAWTEEAKE